MLAHLPPCGTLTIACASIFTLFSSSSPICIGDTFLLGVGTGLLLNCFGLGARFSAGGKMGVPETERAELSPIGGGDMVDFWTMFDGGWITGECLVGDKPDN